MKQHILLAVLLVVFLLFLTPVLAPTLSFRSITTATASGTASITCTAPAGLVEDDLIITTVGTSCLGACTPPTVTTHPTYTFLTTNTRALAGGAYTARQSYYYKVANATEPGSYTWSFSGTSFSSSLSCAAYDNPDTADPFDLDSTNTFTGTATPSTPSITTSNDNALIVTHFISGCGGGSCTWTPPSGETERADFQNVEFNDEIQTTAGSSGTKQATSTSVGVGITWISAFNSEPDAADTCTLDPNTDDSVTCSDLCNQTTDVNMLGGNITFTGTGTFRLSANITNWTIINTNGGCVVRVNNSGGFRQ